MTWPNDPSASAPPASAGRASQRRIDADIASISRISAVPTILRVVSEATGLRLALIARVTETSWTACAVLDRMGFGLEVGGQLEVATTLCSEVRDSHMPIIIEHASAEPGYCDHPAPRLYGMESYIAVPIFRADGEYFGNVCALDRDPARLRDDKTLAMMRLFAELIALQLVADEQSVLDREALSEERETAEEREEFIAVLGHDLQNPLFAILAGSGFLLGLPQEEGHRAVLERIRGSSRRMSQLVDELMDFARGRLGRGIPLQYAVVDVTSLLSDVTEELRTANPGRTVEVEADVPLPVRLDRARAAQMLSNLVGNAVLHGHPGSVVIVRAAAEQGELAFTIASRGPQIPRAVRRRLFQPFARGHTAQERPGLGMGLYIAAEIARAHGGHIAVDSKSDGETTFTVRLPHALLRDAMPRAEA